MNRYNVMDEAEFEQSFPEIYNQVCTELGIGFVPDIFRCVVNASPELALSSWNMVRINLCSGLLPRITKELIFSFVARKKNCEYCDMAHHALAIQHGCSMDNIDGMLNDIHSINNPALKAVLEFTNAAVDNDFSKIADLDRDLGFLGFGQDEIAELVGMVSCALYMVNIADSLQVSTDQRFKDIVNTKTPLKIA